MKNKLTIKCESEAQQQMTALAKACGWQFVEFVDEDDIEDDCELADPDEDARYYAMDALERLHHDVAAFGYDDFIYLQRDEVWAILKVLDAVKMWNKSGVIGEIALAKAYNEFINYKPNHMIVVEQNGQNI